MRLATHLILKSRRTPRSVIQIEGRGFFSELLNPLLVQVDHLLDIGDILAVDLVGLADPAVNIQNFVDLQVVRLESPVGDDRPHVEFTLTLSTTWELVGCLLDC